MASDLVKNAASPKQVKRAERLEKEAREAELSDLRAVLSTPEGRRFVWRMIGHCKTFGSVWTQSAQIHYNAGQQDVGHYLMAEVIEADETAFLLMMQESQAAAKYQRQQTDAERTQSVTQENTNNG